MRTTLRKIVERLAPSSPGEGGGRGRERRVGEVRAFLALTAAAWLALPRAAAACATCYGAADAPMTKGMNNAILTLIALVGVVYVGIGKVFLDFRRRARKLEKKATVRQRLRLIHGEKR